MRWRRRGYVGSESNVTRVNRMTLRGAIPGTKHTTLLARDEPEILAAIRTVIGIRKVEPSYLVWTGPTRRCLHLRGSKVPRIIHARLFLQHGKRALRIYLRQDASADIEIIRADLSRALAKFDLPIEIKEGGKNRVHEQTQITAVQEPDQLTPEELWAWCVSIHDEVGRFKQLEDREIEIEVELEELRTEKSKMQAKAIEAFLAGREAATSRRP